MEQTSHKPILGTVLEWFWRSAPNKFGVPTKTLAEHACCRAEGHRAIMMSDKTACQLYWQPTWGLSSIFEPDLTSKRRPMPRSRSYRTGTRGAPSDVPQQSTCGQITAVWGASRPTSGAVASAPLFIGTYIWGWWARGFPRTPRPFVFSTSD